MASHILYAILLLLSGPLTARWEEGDEKQKTNSPPIERNGSKANGGIIEGKVLFDGRIPARQKLMVVKDRDICGKVDHYDQRLVVDKEGGIQNAVVSLTKVRGGKPLSAMGKEFVLDQKGCSYSPRVLLVPAKKEVTILNNDGILHNIHTFSTKNPPVNIAQTKFQKELKMKFSFPEKIQVKCDVHGWMGAWFIVVDHPYHALTDEEGRFMLTDIPPGTYTVSSWQELMGEQTREITVGKGSRVTLEFRYKGETEGGRSE